MTLVHIPFLPMFEKSMLEGTKTMTSRTRKYGNVGDTFDAFGATFRIVRQFREQLIVVVTEHYREEGFESKEELVKCWEGIHPIKGYAPEQWVWVHIFKKVEGKQS